MAEITSLDAQTRDRAGKGAARAIRRSGMVPCVIYGDKKDSLLIVMDPRHLSRELNKGSFFISQFSVKVNGDAHRVMARDVQFHPVTDAPLHVDFLRVTGKTKVTVDIPVVFKNEEDSPGLARGGVINIVRHTIEVNAAVDNIPEEFVFDLAGLEIGDSAHISMITMPEGVEPTISDRDFTVATIASPTAVKDEAAEAAAAALEAAEAAEGEEGEEGEAVEGEEGEAAEGEKTEDGGGGESKSED